MKETYSLKAQRESFMITMRNDVVLKAVDGHHEHFEQIGAGRKAFGMLWNNTAFRLIFNMIVPFIMLLLDCILPFRDCLVLVCHKKHQNLTDRLFIGCERRLYALSKSASLQKEGDIWLRLKSNTYSLPEQKPIITIYDLVTIYDVVKSSWQAFRIHVSTIINLGYDKYFLSLNAYYWCMTDFALRHIPINVELIYSYICDRNAILVDRLPHYKKTMIQHGTMHFGHVTGNNPNMEYREDKGFYIWKSLYKSSPSKVYCYTADDEWALSNSVIANRPVFIYMGYGFKPAFKPTKKSVLIVANYYIFAKQEEFILQQLQNLDIEIYLKNHPVHSNSLYSEMRRNYRFNFIEGKDTKLPDVDLLISYDSTLAYEYASVGTKVLYYGQFELQDVKKKVTQFLQL